MSFHLKKHTHTDGKIFIDHGYFMGNVPTEKYSGTMFIVKNIVVYTYPGNNNSTKYVQRVTEMGST